MATTEKYPTDPNLMRYIASLEARIEKLERGSNATVTTFHDSAGTVLMRAGTDPATETKKFEVGRDDGQSAIVVDGAAQEQTIKVYDRTGQMIVGESANFDGGLIRPSVSHNVVVLPDDSPVARGNTIYQTCAESHFRKSNPAVEVVLYYLSSDGATGVQFRFREGDTFTQLTTQNGAVYEPLFSPAPAVQTKLVTPPLVLPPSFKVGGEIRLIVESQKVGGSGLYTAHVLAVRGADG